MDWSDLAFEEELAGCLDECREWTVGVFGQELLSSERAALPGPLKLLDKLMQSVRPRDVNPVAHARVPMCTRRDYYSVDLSVRAMAVVAAQVACVGCCLIQVGLIGLGLAFEL
jgi:hypothetical protein